MEHIPLVVSPELKIFLLQVHEVPVINYRQLNIKYNYTHKLNNAEFGFSCLASTLIFYISRKKKLNTIKFFFFAAHEKINFKF